LRNFTIFFKEIFRSLHLCVILLLLDSTKVDTIHEVTNPESTWAIWSVFN